MRLVTIRKWLYCIASGACLLQGAGCPDAGQIRDSAAGTVSSFISGVASMYIKAAVDATIGA